MCNRIRVSILTFSCLVVSRGLFMLLMVAGTDISSASRLRSFFVDSAKDMMRSEDTKTKECVCVVIEWRYSLASAGYSGGVIMACS
jgi:hypothetical protein